MPWPAELGHAQNIVSTELTLRTPRHLPRPVHRAEARAHLARDLGPGPALGAQLGHSGGVHGSARAPDALALGASHGYAGAHALADELAFELGDAGKDAEDQAPIWRRGVHAFVQRDELNAKLVEFAEGINQLAQAAGEAI